MMFRIVGGSNTAWMMTAAGTLLAMVSITLALTVVSKRQRDRRHLHQREASSESHIAVAFLGNSILYFNDCPRLVEQMLLTKYSTVRQNSCLRGGATLSSLWEKGNGMQEKFATPQARQEQHRPLAYDIGAATVQELLSSHSTSQQQQQQQLFQPRNSESGDTLVGWDYIVMNDHTQGPARQESKEKTKQVLKDKYLPLIQSSPNPHPVIVFLQTAAYRYPAIRGTEDLGDMDDYTNKLAQGYQEYVELVKSIQSQSEAAQDGTNNSTNTDKSTNTNNSAVCAVRIAPVGEAYRWLYHNNNALWEKLYSWDDFHPSPYGTWLEACTIYSTITGECAPMYDPMWWEVCRYMQPPDEKPLPLPNDEEALELRQVACFVCGVPEAEEEDVPDPFPSRL